MRAQGQGLLWPRTQVIKLPIIVIIVGMNLNGAEPIISEYSNMEGNSAALGVIFAGATALIGACFAGIRLSRCTIIKCPCCALEREVTDAPTNIVAV